MRKRVPHLVQATWKRRLWIRGKYVERINSSCSYTSSRDNTHAGLSTAMDSLREIRKICTAELTGDKQAVRKVPRSGAKQRVRKGGTRE